jgi:hypothetical protein
MKFGNEVWLILSREYISPNLFAVCSTYTYTVIMIQDGVGANKYTGATTIFAGLLRLLEMLSHSPSTLPSSVCKKQ